MEDVREEVMSRVRRVVIDLSIMQKTIMHTQEISLDLRNGINPQCYGK